MTGCCVPLCKGSTSKGLRCYPFPRDKARRKKWEAQVKRDRWEATDNSQICELHFEQDQYQDNRGDGRRLLKPTAVPTLFDCRRENLPPTWMEESARLKEDGRVPPPRLLLEGQWNGTAADENEQDGKPAIMACKDWQCGDARNLSSCHEQLNMGQPDCVNVKGGHGAALLGVASCPLKATEDIRFRCLSCAFLTADQRGIMNHLVAHGEEPQFKFDRSFESSGSRSRLHDHIQMHASDKSNNSCRPHKCEKCSKVVVKPGILRGHIELCTCEELHERKHCPTAFAHLSKLIVLYKCELCPEAFTSIDALTTHTQTHTREKAYKCELCTQAFTGIDALTTHTRAHTGEKPYRCKLCPRAFTKNSHLTQHNRVHTGEKPYKCKVCPKAFAKNFRLTEHNRVHTGEKPYKCELCPEAYAESYKLTLHKRMHAGEKPFKCELCPQVYAENYKLTLHKRVHTGEKPFKCELCPQAFTRIASLTTHTRAHTGEKLYRCKLCPKAFTKNSHLTQHNQVHTGEKPYRCKVCPKAFAKNSRLTEHNRVHTGEKPFKCELCPQAFAEKYRLTRHKRMHTG